MHRKSLSLIVAVGLMAANCKKDGGAAPEPHASAVEQAQSGQPAAFRAPAPEVTAVLQAYESIRASLAQDQTGGIAAAADNLSAAAATALANASSSVRVHLEGIRTEAQSLKSAATSDIETMRRGFGEISRHVVALVQASPSLQTGRFVFECPMAKGYKKWVQGSASIENPYMGKEMLACGAATTWVP